MVSFERLLLLDTHVSYLQKKLWRKDFFLVWGVVRDLLLWLTDTLVDIDLTLAWKPEEIYKKIDTTDISHFITEKFWTITLIPKKKTLKYEITPLREEWWYDDFRHPWIIKRSNDIILDAQRRDFTINAMYYWSSWAVKTKQKKISSGVDLSRLAVTLDKKWITAVQEYNLLIIQDHSLIHKLFADGIFHEDYLAYLINAYSLPLDKTWVRCIIDPYKGIQDSLRPLLRAVGDPDKRFTEDALRIIRAIRFVCVLNEKIKQHAAPWVKAKLFDIVKETRGSLKRNHLLIKKIAKERIKDELTKVFAQGNPFSFVALLDEAGLLPVLFPAVAATKHLDQPIRYHAFDVYTHTLLCLYELQKLNKNYLVRLAMLYHDVGKVGQFWAYAEWLDKDQIRAILAWPLNHRRSGSGFVKKEFSDLWFSSAEIREIMWYVTNHHRLEEVLDAKEEYKEKKLRKILSEWGYEKVEDLIDITIADRIGSYNPLQNSADISDVLLIRKQLKKLHKQEGQFTMKKLAVNGNDIQKSLKVVPWPLLWDLLKQAFDWVLGDVQTRNVKEKILTYLQGYLKNKK